MAGTYGLIAARTHGRQRAGLDDGRPHTQPEFLGGAPWALSTLLDTGHPPPALQRPAGVQTDEILGVDGHLVVQHLNKVGIAGDLDTIDTICRAGRLAAYLNHAASRFAKHRAKCTR